MSDDLVKALETMDWDDIRDRPSAAGVLMEEAAAEITRLRAAINDALTAPWPVPELNSTWHQEPIGPNETPEEAIKRLVNVRAEWAVYKNNCENPVIAELRAALATARREGMEMPPEFLEWMKREMPSGTHIHNPEWWASRVWKATIRAAAGEGTP